MLASVRTDRLAHFERAATLQLDSARVAERPGVAHPELTASVESEGIDMALGGDHDCVLIAGSHLLDLDLAEKTHFCGDRSVFLILDAELPVRVLSEGEDGCSFFE